MITPNLPSGQKKIVTVSPTGVCFNDDGCQCSWCKMWRRPVPAWEMRTFDAEEVKKSHEELSTIADTAQKLAKILTRIFCLFRKR